MTVRYADPDALKTRVRLVRANLEAGNQIRRSRATRVAKTYAADPVAWMHDCIRWDDDEGPADYQEATLAALPEYLRVAVRGPRGAGKTAPAAWAVLWFATTRDGLDDWKVPTTAGAWRQLTKFLWPEIHRWARRLRWDRLGREPFHRGRDLLERNLKLSTGEAFAIASNDPDLLEGAHAPRLFAVVDEGKAVPEGSWDAIEGYFSDPGEKLALALSTPGAPLGRFYDLHRRAAGYEDWHPIHVTLDQALKAGRVSGSWVDQRAAQWGEDSPMYRTYVLGEFAGGDDAAIPLSWVEAAVERWHEFHESGKPAGSLTAVGVDVADTGSDQTVIARRRGWYFEPLDYLDVKGAPGEGTQATVGRVKQLVREPADIWVDSLGVGAGVTGQLREVEKANGWNVQGFNAMIRMPADYHDDTGELEFLNKRAAAWWNLRELLHPTQGVGLMLPPDDRLLGELTAPVWLPPSSGGKVRLESKDEIRKRIGRSTDSADAVVMACWREQVEAGWIWSAH